MLWNLTIHSKRYFSNLQCHEMIQQDMWLTFQTNPWHGQMCRWKRRKCERHRKLHRLHVLEVRVEPGPLRSSPSFPYEVPFCGEISEIRSGDGPNDTTKTYKRKFISWNGNKTNVAQYLIVVLEQMFSKNAKMSNFFNSCATWCFQSAIAGDSNF